MEKEILTIEEAADYLKIGKRSIYKLAKDGKIPGKKVLNPTFAIRRGKQENSRHYEV